MAYRGAWTDRTAPAMGRQPLRSTTGNSEADRRPMLPTAYDPPTVPLDDEPQRPAPVPPLYFVGLTLIMLTVMLVDCLLAVTIVYVGMATLWLGVPS